MKRKRGPWCVPLSLSHLVLTLLSMHSYCNGLKIIEKTKLNTLPFRKQLVAFPRRALIDRRSKHRPGHLVL